MGRALDVCSLVTLWFEEGLTTFDLSEIIERPTRLWDLVATACIFCAAGWSPSVWGEELLG